MQAEGNTVITGESECNPLSQAPIKDMIYKADDSSSAQWGAGRFTIREVEKEGLTQKQNIFPTINSTNPNQEQLTEKCIGLNKSFQTFSFQIFNTKIIKVGVNTSNI